MTRLGLRLALRSGREALVRLAATTAAVAIGVTLLLAVLAEFHAYQVTSRRPAWEATTGARSSAVRAPRTELWNYSESLYQGRFVEQLDVAALGPGAPVPPGVAKLPSAGQLYASPALARLLRTVPHDQLGARFAGSEVGVIGRQALTDPDELVAVVGYDPATLAALPRTIRVGHIASAPETEGTTTIYRLAFGAAAIAVLFPLLVLIGTASRLAAARREERYAAIRLVGGTPAQINELASIDAAIGAVFGTLLGVGIFVLVRPALATVSLSGARFFPQYVTPTAWGYLGALVIVPVGAALASLVSLGQVRISPLGVSRKVTPPRPGLWRVVPMLVGVPLFVFPVVRHPDQPRAGFVFVGLLLVMAGLGLSGAWLTLQGARLVSLVSRGAASLLASRRLADNPKGSFRSVSGLVLAVFVGTAIAVLAPAVNRVQNPTGNASLSSVLRVPYQNGPGYSPGNAARLLSIARGFRGTTVIPLYENPSFHPKDLLPPGQTPPGYRNDVTAGPFDSVITCTALAHLRPLGRCPSGVDAVQLSSQALSSDNPLQIYTNLPLVTPRSPASPADLSRTPLAAVLIQTDSAATRERVRTALTRFEATMPTVGAIPLSAWRMGTVEPETFGEVAAIRTNDTNNFEHIVLSILGITLLIAGCSLAASVGGSLVERKRPFTLLRVSGAPSSVLRRAVLLESVVPLVLTSFVAAVAGMVMVLPVIRALVPVSVHIPSPGPPYYVTVGAGLLVALAVIAATLPLLGRLTRPETARFE